MQVIWLYVQPLRSYFIPERPMTFVRKCTEWSLQLFNVTSGALNFWRSLLQTPLLNQLSKSSDWFPLSHRCTQERWLVPTESSLSARTVIGSHWVIVVHKNGDWFPLSHGCPQERWLVPVESWLSARTVIGSHHCSFGNPTVLISKQRKKERKEISSGFTSSVGIFAWFLTRSGIISGNHITVLVGLGNLHLFVYLYSGYTP